MNFLDLASELIHEILLEAALKRSLSGKVVKTSACLQDLRGGLEKHTHLGNLEIVRYILDGGIKIHDWLGGPSLEAACRENHEDVVDLLLERGANLNVYYERKERLGWLGDQILCVGAEGSDLRIGYAEIPLALEADLG
ncbi:predicted protein [Sclerotinia sclerotiorum 1980 UF-70]|uniref:Uncharacterized protein n=1 Tax=Sclerotinia sclerotiorum (strain ATCC 18683 / 1980 / Ss-1) TaxID=665079 RepID=A7EW35_SCLS1|nr:predicted protein [Sclerotinia sclerotiorum 1980 UF-70]EDN93677.1 predicted protein [Sclerotinia sclerotiorum 1980 UF-70]